jgi:hypothetical protein
MSCEQYKECVVCRAEAYDVYDNQWLCLNCMIKRQNEIDRHFKEKSEQIMKSLHNSSHH